MSTISDSLYKVLKKSKLKYKLKKELNDQKKIGVLNKPKKFFFTKTIVSEKLIMDYPVYLFKQKKTYSEKWIFYIHGGAYVKGLSSIYYRFIKLLLKKTKLNIIAFDYPLAPKATKDDIYEFLLKTYLDLKKEINEENFIFLGDSAGGGLAFGFLQLLKEKGYYHKNKLILISPWLDLSLENPDIINYVDLDPILDLDTLKYIGNIYKKEDDIKNYLYSPIYGDFKGLGNIYVFIGTYDILYPDTLLLEKKAKLTNHRLELYIYEKMIHTWVFFGFKESNQALEDITNVILANQ
jgi:monoterpene epsilon-lactone hydrolase